jgi:hypothetical protein
MWWRRLRYALTLVALCAIATCPAAHRSCTAQVRAREADELLTYLAERVEAAIAATGRVPPLAAGPTPAEACCARGDASGACPADPAAWAAPGWRALAFSVDGPHRFSYAYLPDASGRAAVLRAVGDVDCSGAPVVRELVIRIDAGGVRRVATPAPAVDTGSAAAPSAPGPALRSAPGHPGAPGPAPAGAPPPAPAGAPPPAPAGAPPPAPPR